MTDSRSFSVARLAIATLAMASVVVASNFLVQFPVQGMLGAVNLADILTWGAFTYPAAFLVTDLTNRRFGPNAARFVVVVGFLVAVLLSIWLATPRIAIASGSAFLVAQLLDVTVFDRLRRATWWKAPIVSSLLGSIVDTVLFFSLAFAAIFSATFGYHDDFAAEVAPLFGVFALEAPRWVSWALGDFAVKILVAVALLAPYRIVLSFLQPAPNGSAA
ncbi:queuosine precursor transporter [Roseibium polysiphoniae]|uniref:Probable queuosine precursor transporter n=1 Tax=Roseibium polysiphoniae TaxID=2571221 RepID=A0ABR9CE40_9HYPH|nr:queuosine precursor transporter [Roseibium polysiphoniae]MBD8877325.1 queuosine precursor transporter [Roseibium polysiphoniae]